MRVETFQKAFKLSKRSDAAILNLLKRNRPFLKAKNFHQWCIHTFSEQKRISKAGKELLLNYPQIVIRGCDYNQRTTKNAQRKQILTNLRNKFKNQINQKDEEFNYEKNE